MYEFIIGKAKKKNINNNFSQNKVLYISKRKCYLKIIFDKTGKDQGNTNSLFIQQNTLFQSFRY